MNRKAFIDTVSTQIPSLPDRSLLILEVIGGSYGRGVATPQSDVDIYAIYAPTFDEVYPKRVPGFGTPIKPFSVVHNTDVAHYTVGDTTTKIDVTAMSAVHFFNMLLNFSPIHYDLLYMPRRAYSCSPAGRLLLELADSLLSVEVATTFFDKGSKMLLSLADNPKSDHKKIALAARFCMMGTHVFLHRTIKPEYLVHMTKSILGSDGVDGAMENALRYYNIALTVFTSAKPAASLPETVSEDTIHTLLQIVIDQQWDDGGIYDRR